MAQFPLPSTEKVYQFRSISGRLRYTMAVDEQLIKMNKGQFTGHTGIVKQVMHDGRSLDITLANGKMVFLDVTLVGEIQERTHYAKGEPNLGPVANSVVQAHK